MKRFSCTDEGSTYESYGAPIMKEDPKGAYVLHSDFEKLVEALKFYADYMNYSIDSDTSEMGFTRRCVLYKDIEERNEVSGLAGYRARQTLKELGLE